jgi:hypothetical protein
MRFHFVIALFLFTTACKREPLSFGTGAELSVKGERPNALFGSSGDLVGDINGDGIGDVAIGAPGDSRNGTDSGTVYIYAGEPSSSPTAVIVGNAGDRFGTSIAGLGDVNDDGVEDFAVTSMKASKIGAPSKAAVYIFFGGVLTDRTSDSANEIILADSSIGLTVSSAGDLDQNGGLDLAIGASQKDAVYVFFHGDLFPTSSRLTLSQAGAVFQGSTGSSFGASVSAAGNINGHNEGLQSRFGDDLVIGAPGGSGSAYVVVGYQGFPRGKLPIAGYAQKLAGPEVGDEFGASVTGIGDFDGDGFGDVAVGAPGKNEGRAELYFGRSLIGVSTVDPAVFTGESDGDRFGAAVAGMLPLGLGGIFPLLVGAPGNDFTNEESGAVYLFSELMFAEDSSLRGVTANASFADRRIRNPLGGVGGAARMGSFIRAGLDINNDGIGDLLTGSPGSDASGIDSGAALILW